jgi:nitrile hydratase accessory protein
VTEQANPLDDLVAGGLAPPMLNGEVVFDAPWQGRVFGMARALADAGVYAWDDFRACLIDEIGAWDRQPDGPFAYFDHFLRALERVLAQRELIEPQALHARVGGLLSRPHGHDHGHDHHHDHDHDHDHDHGHSASRIIEPDSF